MNPERPAPPITSPHGSGVSSEKVPKPSAKISPIIPVHLSLESALRSSCAELLCPTNFFTLFAISIIFTVELVGTVPTHGAHLLRDISPLELWTACSALLGFVLWCGVALWKLLFSSRFEVEIRQDGVCTHYRKRDVLLSWHKILLVLHFNGDIWVVCMGSGCLIPRESFTSREQSRQFGALVRQLWESNGAAWNTTFGLTHSGEN